MKKILMIASLFLLFGCNDGKTIYVWNMKDIIGLWIGGIILTVFLIILACAWISDKISERKRKSNVKS